MHVQLPIFSACKSYVNGSLPQATNKAKIRSLMMTVFDWSPGSPASSYIAPRGLRCPMFASEEQGKKLEGKIN